MTLKSLTVLELNGRRITGVEYGSAAPLDRQLTDLRLSLKDKTSLTDFLGALRGARLQVKSGTAVITGRLRKTTELSPSFSVCMLEKDLPGKVGRYLDFVSAGWQPDVKALLQGSAIVDNPVGRGCRTMTGTNVL